MSSLSKGKQVNIPAPMKVLRQRYVCADAGRRSSKSYLFLLTDCHALESDYPEKGLGGRQSTKSSFVSGALRTVLENARTVQPHSTYS